MRTSTNVIAVRLGEAPVHDVHGVRDGLAVIEMTGFIVTGIATVDET